MSNTDNTGMSAEEDGLRFAISCAETLLPKEKEQCADKDYRIMKLETAFTVAKNTAKRRFAKIANKPLRLRG